MIEQFKLAHLWQPHSFETFKPLTIPWNLLLWFNKISFPWKINKYLNIFGLQFFGQLFDGPHLVFASLLFLWRQTMLFLKLPCFNLNTSILRRTHLLFYLIIGWQVFWCDFWEWRRRIRNRTLFPPHDLYLYFMADHLLNGVRNGWMIQLGKVDYIFNTGFQSKNRLHVKQGHNSQNFLRQIIKLL